MSKILYASYIDVPEDLMFFLKAVRDTPVRGNFCEGITQHQYSLFTREDFFSLNLYHFHILVFCTKKQNHLFSHLNNDFFNNLSQYKDKLKVSFRVSNGCLIPYGVHYNALSSKTNINLKKHIKRLFSDSNIQVREEAVNKKNHKKQNTNFLFD